jgi:hypothetical protein
MEEEVEEEYKAAATVDSRRACPSGCPRAVRGGVTATRRQAALGKGTCSRVCQFSEDALRKTKKTTAAWWLFAGYMQS